MVSFDKPKLRADWAYFAFWAIRNINQELVNQYQAITEVAIDATLETFNVNDYFPKAGKKLPLLNALTGPGTAFAAVSSFRGLVEGVAGAVGAIIAAVGTYP